MKPRNAITAILTAFCLLAGCAAPAATPEDPPSAASAAPQSSREEQAPAGPEQPEEAAPGYLNALIRAPADPEEGEADDAYRQALADFSYETAAALLAGGEENSNYSPVSLYLALGMLANNAGGESRAAALELLGADSLDSLNANSAALLSELLRESGEPDGHGFPPGQTAGLDIANSLWTREGYDYDEAFADAVSRYYRGWLFEADFAGGGADAYAGEWITEQVRGTMEPSLNTGAGTAMYIINTVYYSSGWWEYFPESRTEEQSFTLQNGERIPVTMMHEHRDESSYVDGDGFVAVSKSLDYGSMRFVLPDAGVTVDDLLSDPARLSRALGDADWTPAEILFGLPKFTFSSSYDLDGILAAFGLAMPGAEGVVFEDAGGEPVAVGGVQQTHIAVDEEGVDASAYTETRLVSSFVPEPPPYVEIILDRPFLYGIYINGTLLFTGVVRNPAG